MVAPYLIGIFMAEKEVFYCYSLPLMHFLKALGIDYLFEGYNKNSQYPYFAFEKNAKLGKALSGWDNFKKSNFNGTAVNPLALSMGI